MSTRMREVDRPSPATVRHYAVGHNRHKGAMRPPWWYLLSLERRRHSYFPPGADVRVFATMSESDIEARATTPGKNLAR